MRVRQAGNVWIKIADYGISQHVSTGLIKVGRSPSIGTPGFIAPELLEHTDVSKEVSSEKVIYNTALLGPIKTLHCMI